jgi:peptidoglycan hydrolase-like protein with peptidoglycan-binding domain
MSERAHNRLALLSFALALLVAPLASVAQASSGGISSSGGASPDRPPIPFGSRVLRLGMEGDDVAVLNGIVKSKAYGSAVRFGRTFTSPTASAVARFQRRVELRPTGVLTKVTARKLTASMRHAGATWYGPGFYGRRTACGQVLRTGTIGVAHKTLPCGTLVTFYYHGESAIAPVIDRGPYTAGNAWDLTNGLRRVLGFGGSDQIRWAVAR